MPNASPSLIAILGAESTGKTTLAQALGAHFNSPWVAEYLRDFCDKKSRTPRSDEQRHIMKVQATREQRALTLATANHAPFVFCDTAPLLTAIYSEYVFADTSLYIEAKALHARYTITIVLTPDIAWVEDGLQRAGERVRGDIHRLIKHSLGAIDAATVEVCGQGGLRTKNAIDALQNLTMPSR